MDQSSPKSARWHHGLLMFALALTSLPGCAWLRDNGWLKDKTASAVPADPERKQIADSQPEKNSASPVKTASPAQLLDGSAAGTGAAAIPNAPGISGSQMLANGTANNDPSLELPDMSDSTAVHQAAAATRENGRVVVAGAAAEEGQVAAAGDRGEEVGAPEGRAMNDRPTISKADESLTNESSLLEFEGAGVKVKNGEVAATVNGQPIFVEDILKQMPREQADWLDKAKREAPPDQYSKLRRQVIQQYLPQHIDRELLVQALKLKIKDDQLKTVQKQIDNVYNTEYLPYAMKQAGVTTEAELEQELRKNGSSIEVLRSQFRNKELAQQYLGSKAMPKAGFDLPEVKKYYQEHKQDYYVRAQAKWEQIRLLYSKYGGQAGAKKKAAEILERLENGEDFAAIARECSDGPTASTKGGLRGWTTEGTLKDKEIEQALYVQPVGVIGEPIETDMAIEIIRVIDRTPSAYQSFLSVQDDIKAQLKNALWQKSTKALLNDLREKATIESFIDRL